MLRRLTIAGVLGASMALLPGAAAAAATDYRVDIRKAPITVQADGYATATFWLRCSPGLNAFEYNVGISQGDVHLSAGDIGPHVLTCDGKRQRVDVTLGGGLSTGAAEVTVYVGIYDPAQGGGDIAVEDSEVVRLR